MFKKQQKKQKSTKSRKRNNNQDAGEQRGMYEIDREEADYQGIFVKLGKLWSRGCTLLAACVILWETRCVMYEETCGSRFRDGSVRLHDDHIAEEIKDVYQMFTTVWRSSRYPSNKRWRHWMPRPRWTLSGEHRKNSAWPVNSEIRR